MVQVIESGIC